MENNGILTSRAQSSLRGKWGLAIITFFVASIIMGICGATFLGWFLIGSFEVGLAIFSLNYLRKNNPKIENLFGGFSSFENVLSFFLAYLLKAVFTFLWTLLLVIPGIIAAISYSMTYYILADNPELGSMEAINLSKKMMRGHKWQYFGLCIRFFLWSILCCLTAGIGFLFLIPYMSISFAAFYENIKLEQASNQTIK